jgi:hypothetical protein
MSASPFGIGSPTFNPVQPTTWGTFPSSGQGFSISPFAQQAQQCTQPQPNVPFGGYGIATYPPWTQSPTQQIVQLLQIVPQQLQQLQQLTYLQQQQLQQLLQIVPVQFQQLQHVFHLVPQLIQQLQQQLLSQQSQPFYTLSPGVPQVFAAQPGQVM